jgi:DNA-binding MarR family transcriptional regulator
MEPRATRELDILEAIDEGAHLSQRALAQRLGVAVGLANLYLRRMAAKGYIKLGEFPQKPLARKRLRYVLTARGIAEKTRLTCEYMSYSLGLFKRCRRTLQDGLGRLPRDRAKRIALLGTGTAAELAYLTLREFGLEPIGVFADEPGGAFLGFPVRAPHELVADEVDWVILATFEPPAAALAQAQALGLPRDKFLTLRRLAAPGDVDGAVGDE